MGERMKKQESEQIKKLRAEVTALRKMLANKESAGKKPRSASAALKKRAAMFQAVINALPDMVFLLGSKGELLAANRAVTHQLKKNTKKKSVFDLFPHPVEGVWITGFHQAREGKRPVHFERELNGKYYSHYLYPVLDNAGKVKFSVILVQDITDYHLTVNALSSSEEKYKTLIENISDIIYAVNEEGVIIYINPAVETFLGYNPEEVNGGSFENFLHPDDVKLIRNDLEGFLSGRAQQKEYRFLHKNGSLRWGRVSSHAQTFKGTVIGYQGVITDISQTRAFNISRLQAAQENVLWRLASSFATTVEQPIREARNLLLRHSQSTDSLAPVDSTIRAMMHDLEEISMYLKNFLVVTNEENRGVREITVNTLIENSLSLVKDQFHKENIELQWSLKRDLSPVQAEPLALIQAFLNLLTHSLRGFSQAGVARKILHISTEMEKDRVIVFFCDNSQIIPEEVLAHLSDPFYVNPIIAGSGMELSIAMHLVESARGTFEVLSGGELGGTTVKITFPALIPLL